MSFEELCNVFARIEATSKRLEINDILKEYFGEFLRKGEEAIDGLVKVVHLCLSRLGPAYAGVELGLGEQLLMKAISGATGHSLAKTKQEVEEKGDIGLVAETSRSSQKTMFQPKPLTVAHIFKTLQEIATVTGQNSMQRKVDKVKTLFVACKGKEARYLFRLLEGKLRIGLAEQSVLAALAHASAEIFDARDAQEDDQAIFEPVSIIKSVYKYRPLSFLFIS